MAVGLDDKVNLVALCAAPLSTLTAAWQMWVWFRNGPRLKVTANANMKTFGGPRDDENTYFVINATKTGTSITTITHVLMFYYLRKIDALRRRPNKTFFVNHNSEAYPIPYVLAAGCMFTSMAIQTPDAEEMSRSGRLYLGVQHSVSRNPVMVQVRPVTRLPAKTSDED